MLSRERHGNLNSVRDFWEAESCGERYGLTADDYARIDQKRYDLEPQIPGFARFGTPFSGLALEVGLGTGADFQRNVARGGTWCGLDLTERSLQHVRTRVGNDVPLLNGDAQRLPFSDCSFDLLYSWGVLLCCQNMDEAISEVYRVLKPNGTALIMLYHSRSWVALAAWLRWGWYRGISPRGSVTYMESPGTKAFPQAEATRLFSQFSHRSVRSVHTSWDTRWFGPIGRLGGDKMGWFLLCEAIK